MKEINWKVRDTVALFMVPYELCLGRLLLVLPLAQNTTFAALLPLLIKVLSLCIIAFLYRDLLKADGNAFKRRAWLKLLLCAGAAYAITWVLKGARWTLGIPQSAELLESVTDGLPLWLFIMTSLSPIMAPLTEEMIFRHALFYKFRTNKTLCAIMLIVSAFLFGAVHLGNFGGNLLLTVPYMVVGLVYNLIYFFTKNIWYTISIHFMFNFAQSVLPTIFLVFMVLRM